MSADLLSNTTDLYSLFLLTEKATPAEIKKAYYKLALQYHPDKQISSTLEEQEERTKKFQSLGFAYSILSDPKKRAKYDRTGETDDLPGIEDLGKDAWDAFFKELWSGVVNAKSIEEFKEKYQGTEEERKDLIEAYNNFKGDMDKIMASVPGSNADDEPRFREILKEAIKSKEIRSYKKFIETSGSSSMNRRKKEAEREAKEAEEMAKKFGLDKKLLGSNEEELKQIIVKRQKKRMNALVESLEAKYSSKSKKAKTGKGKSKIEGPTEEEFQAIQEKIRAKNNNS
ncbi:DnaJ domain-containing protein [Glomus cerebriforme]|uniref:DnaJ domain-containing protein n=1 Tax=Glomus cerebriforme TaxID=658196 RepID=A0A397SN78_9GLOM|nr:DnaJ domain-containing protein [Glomus cerebriforme]